METTGERIRHYRELAGASLQEVADAAGVSRYAIHHYETGKISNVPQKTIEAIARVCHVKPCTLYGWDRYLEECNSKATYSLDDLYEAIAERTPLTKEDVKSAVLFAISMKGDTK